MLPAYYAQRRGDYIYDVTVTKDDSVTVTRRCRAHLSHADAWRVDGSRASQSMFPTHTVLRCLRRWAP
jgi:hypothetical protein